MKENDNNSDNQTD